MFIMNYPGTIRAQANKHHRPSWVERLRELNKQNQNIPKIASLDDIDLRSSVPKIPQIIEKDTAYSEGGESARSGKLGRERNMFAQGHADKGVLFKSSLSTSLPDLPSLAKPKGTSRKFEKLSYKKRIHEDEQAPPPAATIHALAAITPHGYPRLPAIKTSVKKKARKTCADSDVFNIYNTTRHTVEYYEHDGHVYVSDSNRPWKDDCPCKNCTKCKREWLDKNKKGAERIQRKLKNSFHRIPNASPVKEVREET